MKNFQRRVLHLKHTTAATVNFTLQHDAAGNGAWANRPQPTGGGFPVRQRPVAEQEPVFQRGDSDSPYQPGARVRHASFGGGTIQDVDGYGSDARLTVRFDTVGVKKLVARFVQVQP